MIRIYARENAMQRGNSGAARVGSVASAVRYVAKAVLSRRGQESLNLNQLEQAMAHLTSERPRACGNSPQEFLSSVDIVVPRACERVKSSQSAGKLRTVASARDVW
jgi:hypothetical protein